MSRPALLARVVSAMFLLGTLAAAPATKPSPLVKTQEIPNLLPAAMKHAGRGPWKDSEVEAATAWFKDDFHDIGCAFGGKVLAAATMDGEVARLKIKARPFKNLGVMWELTINIGSKDPNFIALAKAIPAGSDTTGRFVAKSAVLAIKPDSAGVILTLDITAEDDRIGLEVMK